MVYTETTRATVASLCLPLHHHISSSLWQRRAVSLDHHAWGVVHIWQQARRQHDSWGKTLSFSEIKTHPSCKILMTSKTFHTKSATPLTALTFDWQEGYPTLRPWSPPPLQLWEQIMSNMGEVGCQHCQMSKKQLLFRVNSSMKKTRSQRVKRHPGLIFF